MYYSSTCAMETLNEVIKTTTCLKISYTLTGTSQGFTVWHRNKVLNNEIFAIKPQKKLSDDFKKRTDPWKWLTPEQIGDAVKPNEATLRKKFSKEETIFRDG